MSTEFDKKEAQARSKEMYDDEELPLYITDPLAVLGDLAWSARLAGVDKETFLTYARDAYEDYETIPSRKVINAQIESP